MEFNWAALFKQNQICTSDPSNLFSYQKLFKKEKKKAYLELY